MKEKIKKESIREKFNSFMMMLLGNRLNYYTSYFGESSSYLISLIFKCFANKVSILDEDLKTIRELSNKGTIIYAQKNRSSLDFLFFHHRYKSEGLPYPIFGNFINMIWFQPLKSVFRILLSKFYAFIERQEQPNPYRTDYVRRMTEEGKSSILFLRNPTGLLKRFALKEVDDPVVYLLRSQKVMEKTIYIVPHIIIFHKRPLSMKRTLTNIMFGPKEEPGLLRRIIVFFRYYRKAFIKLGDPINLKEFLEERGEAISGELSFDLRRALLDNIENEERIIKGPALKDRLELFEMVLWDERFKRQIEELSEVTGVPKEKFRKKAISYLEEIAADYNMTYIYLFDIVVTWVWNNIYSGTEVDMEGLKKVREAAKKSSLVIMPCHKSHMDYLILSQIFFHNNLTPPHIAAGVNLTFFPMGHIFRRSGAFFIRRTFKGDPLYPIVFSTYVKTILSEGYSIEYFIEGGRSRTGKLVMPKLGLLSIIIDAFFSGDIDDISFIPVSIGYDKVMEEKSYIKEMSGGNKEKENLLTMIKSRSVLKKRYGTVFINFNDPISLKDFFISSGYNPDEITKTDLRKLQYNLAYKIVHSINEVSIVLTSQLVSAAFMSHIKGALLWEELIDTVYFMLDYLRFTGARITKALNNPRAAIRDTLSTFIEEKLIEIVRHDQDDEEEDYEQVFFVPDEKRLNLEFYKNSTLHFLLPPAFISVSILSRQEAGSSKKQITEDYTYLRKLFKYDFIYDMELTDVERVNQVLEYLKESDIIVEKNGQFKINKGMEKKLYIFTGLIRNYLESYLVTLVTLPDYLEGKKRSEKDLVNRITKVGEKMFTRGEITRPESLSRINIKNALNLFTHEEILTMKSEVDGKRQTRFYTLGSARKGYTKKLHEFLERIEK
ncbi:MAG: 1-acyl-sn-glycerol-3-phosphate acyltransferase [Deltaproteobacteria bacterium]|uniref:1-acyl-sn-glycerol-3-phosphate acyltransferase n=1 Tax=Candidatus Zymogenus saltonus TaxID=2844893 RepID=A0A9D8PQ06_9DELT|nr:1-acyl-sn-glycerol-3-phosphate acyltransferase [Candidatus Zymogenus saltonus]